MKWTELLQMPEVTTVSSHSHVGREALGEVNSPPPCSSSQGKSSLIINFAAKVAE